VIHDFEDLVHGQQALLAYLATFVADVVDDGLAIE
jgi:hypothetical protein